MKALNKVFIEMSIKIIDIRYLYLFMVELMENIYCKHYRKNSNSQMQMNVRYQQSTCLATIYSFVRRNLTEHIYYTS